MVQSFTMVAQKWKRYLIPAGVILVAVPLFLWLLAATEIAAVRPQKQTVVELVIASGRLRAERRSDIGPEVSGVVETVTVDVGDRVRRGDPLIRLLRTDAVEVAAAAEASLAVAKADLARIRLEPYPEEIAGAGADLDAALADQRQRDREFKRIRDLQRKGAVSQSTFDEAKTLFNRAAAEARSAREHLADLEAQPRPEVLRVAEARVAEAVAALDLALADLDKRTLTAPMDGIIVARDIEPGESVSPGAGLLTLADPDPMEIYVETDENNLSRLKVGQTADVIAPAFRNRPFRATLQRIDPLVDPLRGVVGLRLKPQNVPDYALFDMTVDVNIEVVRYSDGLSLPVSAVLRRGDRHAVMAVENGRIRERPVRVLGQSPDYAAVADIPEDRLVARHATQVEAGRRVRPVEESE